MKESELKITYTNDYEAEFELEFQALTNTLKCYLNNDDVDVYFKTPPDKALREYSRLFEKYFGKIELEPLVRILYNQYQLAKKYYRPGIEYVNDTLRKLMFRYCGFERGIDSFLDVEIYLAVNDGKEIKVEKINE